MSESLPAPPLSALSVRLWAEASLQALGEERAAIDALNVFPVPDGDTGTNMFLTLESACAGIAEVFDAAHPAAVPELAEVAEAFGRGAVLGARGNSGVILAQIIRGVASVLAQAPATFTGDVVRQGLRRACDEAYGAVAHPVEGTILTVARAAAEAAEGHAGDDLVGVIESAVAASHVALDQTPDLLPVLRDAGVVDAGGQGLVVVYDALLDVVTGVRRRRPGRGVRAKLPVAARALSAAHGLPVTAAGGETSYEVMYLFGGDDASADALRTRLDALGESLVVTGADGLWNVHVHVHDAGAAIESGLDLGRVHRIRVTYLPSALPAEARVGRRVVAVAHGPGVSTLLEEQGAVVVPAQPRRRPSTADLLDGITRADSAEVLLLPSDSDTLAVAEAAAEQARAAGVRVCVIPTRSVVQSLAAVAVHDPGARFDDDVVAMTRAAGATRYGAVTVASREAMTSAGSCREGDILGLADGDIVEIGASVDAVSRAVLERLLSSGGELVTLVTGEDAAASLADSLEDWLSAQHPGLDLVSVTGGQPLWPLIVGVE
ncbi:MAG: DAK2 domain-containing protein [Actinobacteria bacterium]|nr:DAK2 domain-containing protein [Actinomycetota bacterium]